MIHSLLLAQAAGASDPMAAIGGQGVLKTWMMAALILIAIVALVWPKLSANFKAMIETAVETKLNSVVPGAGTALRPVVDAGSNLVSNLVDSVLPHSSQVVNQPQTRTIPDVTSMVQQRATALKSACPNAPEALRLRWLEEGYDPARAQADYIGVLESQLTNRTAVTSNVVSPVAPPATPPAAPPA